MSINVCGLKSKLNNSIFEDYIKSYDFVCLSEMKINPLLNDVNIDGFTLFCKQLCKNNAYTIGILVKDCFSKYVHVVNDVMSNSVLWMYVKKEILGYDFILGSTYIPHETSPIFDDESFDKITEDIINLRARYKNCELCLMGDFNARTGTCSDFISDDEINDNARLYFDNDLLLSKCKLESHGIDIERYSQDMLTNNNGLKLIEFCKVTDLHIINGRFGQDYKIGHTTCKDVSVVDYVVASTNMMLSVVDFQVDVFDPLLSDVHSPLCLKVFNGTNSKMSSNNENENSTNINYECNINNIKVKWKSEKCSNYKANIDIKCINDLLNELEILDTNTTSVDTINVINDKINDIFLSPAKQLGMVKTINVKKIGAAKNV